MPSEHYSRVKEFMQKAGQETPDSLTIPDEETLELRARLILEEALETIDALGFTASVGGHDINEEEVDLVFHGKTDVIEVADGCADISVVTIGTLVAFGIDDESLFMEVDASNLRKFGPGSHRREDGKWMKPPGWQAPNISGAIL